MRSCLNGKLEQESYVHSETQNICTRNSEYLCDSVKSERFGWSSSNKVTVFELRLTKLIKVDDYFTSFTNCWLFIILNGYNSKVTVLLFSAKRLGNSEWVKEHLVLVCFFSVPNAYSFWKPELHVLNILPRYWDLFWNCLWAKSNNVHK